MRTALLTLSVAALASAAPTFSVETIHGDAAPVISSVNAETVPDNYIVVFKKHVDEASATSHQLWVNEKHSSAEIDRAELRKRSNFPVTSDIFAGIKHTYNIAGGFLGYSGHFDEDIIEQVRRHPDVSYSFLFRFLFLQTASLELRIASSSFGATMHSCVLDWPLEAAKLRIQPGVRKHARDTTTSTTTILRNEN